MSRKIVNEICKAYPGATLDHNLGEGHDSWKVGGKLFAITGSLGDSVSVKTDSIETAQMLIDAGVGSKARYLHRSWIAIPLDIDPDELRHRINVSYELIKSSLSKKAQAALA